MSNFVYKYGAYEHEPGEVVDFKWKSTAHHTARGWRDTSTTVAVLDGILLGCDYAEVQKKIDDLVAEYQWNQKKFALYYPNGQETKYVIDPADPRCLVGPSVRVIDWPVGSQEELVVKRAFRITLTAIWASQEDEIIEYQEKISHVGMAGEIYRWQYCVNMPPQDYTVWPWTTMQIIQEGHSVGFSGYYMVAPGPHPLLPVQYEHLEKRIEAPGKPLHLGRDWVYFPYSWRYVFEVPVYTFVIPA